MKIIKTGILYVTLITIFVSVNGCANKKSDVQNPLVDTDTAFNYLKQLEGKWIVQGGKEGIFRWEFDLTSRDSIIIERLKKGTPTEMLTVYNLDEGILFANHFCQLQNQPKLIAVTSDVEGDLHFLCDGQVGSAKSHDELHMHGVHFKKKNSSLIIWMDMYKNGSKDFGTKYELFRVDSERGRELINLE